MPLREMAGFLQIKDLLVKEREKVSLTGCVDSQKVHMMAGLGDRFKYKIIVTFSDLRAKEIAQDYEFYDRNVVLYPGKDLIFYQERVWLLKVEGKNL